MSKPHDRVSTSKKLIWGLFLTISPEVWSAPTLEMGTPESYCVVYCYLRAPFTVKDNGPGQKIGRVFCDFDAEVTAALPVYNGEQKTRRLQASSIGVFKTQNGMGVGDVEVSTGIIKEYFKGAKTNGIHCHF